MATSVTSLSGNSNSDSWIRDSGNNYIEGRKVGDIEAYIKSLIGFSIGQTPSGTNGRQFYNQPVRFADYDNANFYGLFQGITNFNASIYLGNYQNAKMDRMFEGCRYFNQPINVRGVSSANNMLYGCVNFNSPIYMEVIDNCGFNGFMGSCMNFDQPIVIKGNIGNAYMMFSLIKGVANTPLNINFLGSANMSYMFGSNFTSTAPITIRCETTLNMWDFAYANFNAPVIIYANNFYFGGTNRFMDGVQTNGSPVELHGNVPSSITYQNMFNGCPNFNAPVTIDLEPVGHTDAVLFNLFQNCPNFGSNIYIRRNLNCTGLLNSINANGHRKNVFCNNIYRLNGNYVSNSITGTSIYWTKTTNGYYNPQWNIYIYNNISNI